MTEPHTAVLFWDRSADPSHGRDLGPEPLGIGLRPFQHAAHESARAALAQKFAGLLAQLFQVVAEIEVHRLLSTTPSGVHWLALAARCPASLASPWTCAMSRASGPRPRRGRRASSRR